MMTPEKYRGVMSKADDSDPKERELGPVVSDGMKQALEALVESQSRIAASLVPQWTRFNATIQQSSTYKFQELMRAQSEVAANLARSFNFSKLSFKVDPLPVAAVIAAQASLSGIEKFVQAIDVSALQRAISGAAAFESMSLVNQGLQDALRRQSEQFEQAMSGFRTAFATASFPAAQLQRILETYRPDNLKHLDDLGEIGRIALDEGIVVCGVPRAEIITELLAASSPDQRVVILRERQSAILEDCEELLHGLKNEVVVHCLAAISALRSGHTAAAQSLAANIIESVVIETANDGLKSSLKSRRKSALNVATAPIADLPVIVAVRNIAMRPLASAFTEWWPETDTPIPPRFSRHATAHGATRPGVFTDDAALNAVMFAVSLGTYLW